MNPLADASGDTQRHSVLIFLIEGVQGLGFSGPADVFSCVNAAVSEGFRYDVRTASRDGAPVRTASGLTVIPDCDLADVIGTDTLIMPDVDGIPTSEPEVLRALEDVADRAQRIAAVGTGAFLIAEMGLLSGRKAATHWEFSDELARRFPDVTVDCRDTVMKDGHVTTAGGGASGLDMALSLVEEDLGRGVAQRTARLLLTHLRTPGGQAQFIEPRAREAQSPALRRVQQQVLTNPGADWSLRSLSHHASLSERHVSRLFRTEVGMTAREYVERARVAVASHMLIEGTESPRVIACETGFGTETTMRKSFLHVLQVSPVDYRSRFS
ncbi:GlxA family transcriptional regulator [Streptomyces sp. NPDC018833]|uniref:GlxA family transcriptional regulator n=1 Tax=Streptomyces sp. NPDC018833 TaxID=3365053 RepID=UPI0037894119